jgi:hypothetical protein
MAKQQVRAQMPGDAEARPRGWGIAVFGLVGLMIFIAWISILRARVPNGYKGRHWDPAVSGPWPFPLAELKLWLSVMVGESALIAWALAARGSFSLARRSLILGVVMFGVLLLMSPFGMHAGSPFIEHLIWLFFGSIWLLLCAVGAFVTPPVLRWRRELRRKRRTQVAEGIVPRHE